MATDILTLNEIAEAQASKYLTHNTALRQLEGRTIRVLSRTNSGAPAASSAGDVYVVDDASGNWAAGSVNDIAHYYSGAWHFFTPPNGLIVGCVDEDSPIIKNSTGWVSLPAGQLIGEAPDWGVSLLLFSSGDLTPEHSYSGTGNYDHTGNASGETVFYDTTNSPFAAGDKGKVIKATSGTYAGAVAVITDVISASMVEVFGAGWDADLTSVDYSIYNHPCIVVGDNNQIYICGSTDGVILANAGCGTAPWAGSVSTDSFIKSDLFLGAVDLRHIRAVTKAGGYAGAIAILQNFATGALSSGKQAVHEIDIDESEATGGTVEGLHLTTSDAGLATRKGIIIGTGFDSGITVQGADILDPEHGYEIDGEWVFDRVNSGATYGDSDSDDAFLQSSSVGAEVFEADNDQVLLGMNSDTFEVIGAVLSTVSSKNLNLTFEYSTGEGTWSPLVVQDGTNGFTSSGKITFSAPVDWAMVTTPEESSGGYTVASAYYVRITRTLGGAVPTLPIVDYFKVYTSTSEGFEVRGDGTIKPTDRADADAENNSIYYSTTASRLVYKDSTGTVNNLY